MSYRTYPHDAISEKCNQKYNDKWSQEECFINSLRLYYGHTTEKELKKHKEKFIKLKK